MISIRHKHQLVITPKDGKLVEQPLYIIQRDGRDGWMALVFCGPTKKWLILLINLQGKDFFCELRLGKVSIVQNGQWSVGYGCW